MKFKLEVEMENAAMQDGRDLAGLLTKLAKDIEDCSREDCAGSYGRVRDLNGNTVGKWEIITFVTDR